MTTGAVGSHDDLEPLPQRAPLQLEHGLLLGVGVEPGVHLVNQHQSVREFRDVLGDAQDAAFSRGHVELRVARGAVQVGEEQIPGGTIADHRQVPVPPRQDAVGEDQEFGAQSPGLELLSSELENAPDLGRVREIGEGAKIDFPLGLPASLASHVASAPRLTAPPDHGHPVTAVHVVEFELSPAHRIREISRSPIREIGEQARGRELPRAPAGDTVGARTREKHGGLAAPIRPGQHGYGVLERDPQVLDSPELADPHLGQSVVAMALAGAQRVPDFAELFLHEWRRTPD